MTDEEILSALTTVIADVSGLPEDEIAPGLGFADLAVDSLSMAEIAVTAQDAFGTEISDDQLRYLATVGDVVACVRRQLAAPELQGAAR